MKTLYLECGMGAAGDMLLAALLELHDDPQGFLDRLNKIGIPDVLVTAAPSVKCGIKGTHVRVTVGGQEEGEGCEHSHEHEHGHGHSHNHGQTQGHRHSHDHSLKHGHSHSHNSYHDIEHLIRRLDVSDTVKNNAVAVYGIIAAAESHVHGVPVGDIHFHEVGTMDAVADITGVCMLLEELAPDAVLASPVNTGSGFVRCAHGILPVPAPATAYILQGLPMVSDGAGELCTPTGAALLKHFVKDFCPMPVLSVSKIGYGMGKKDFDRANCLRAFWGHRKGETEDVTELVCNVDDMTPESAAFAQQLLLEKGALDVYVTPLSMKKGRVGLQLTCLCRPEDVQRLLTLVFKHTTTLGVREYKSRRYVLQREQREVETPHGTVRIKTSKGYGVVRDKPEYEDLCRIAAETGKTMQEIWAEIQSLS